MARALGEDAARQRMSVTGGAESVAIAGRDFLRLAIRGSALSRMVLLTELRCHVVSFVFAAADPARLDPLAASLERLRLPAASPPCLKDYASAATLRRRVEPQAVARSFERVAVRFAIGADGKVAHVHVIRAADEERRSIETALRQWQLAPYVVDGRAVELETGLLFDLGPRR
jgi:hypothetical protein